MHEYDDNILKFHIKLNLKWIFVYLAFNFKSACVLLLSEEKIIFEDHLINTEIYYDDLFTRSDSICFSSLR